MDGDSGIFVSLDNDFEKFLEEMKPFVLQFSNRIEKQRCGLWIKKLCEPPSTGTSGRKNRNAYAELLLHMLKLGFIEGPFSSKPDAGPLPPLPPYMSIYFDDTRREKDPLPDWVAELSNRSSGAESGDADLESIMRHASGDMRPGHMSPHLKRRTHSAGGRISDQVRATSPSSVHRATSPSLRTARLYSNMDDRAKDDLFPRRRNVSYNISSDEDDDVSLPRHRSARGLSGPIRASRSAMGSPSKLNPSTASVKSFRDETSLVRIHEKELEMKTKMLEAKFHEEKLKLQQKHDTAVQKILERKNQEIEDVKLHYRGKVKEQEDSCNRLEKKVQSLIKENGTVRESRDKRISELTKTTEESIQNKQQEFELRFREALSTFEDEKFEIQKEHTRNIQDLLDDTNARLQKMEDDTSSQTAEMNAVIRDLECRVQALTNEAENTTRHKNALEKEKFDLQMKCERQSTDLHDLQVRYDTLECTHSSAVDCHERDSKSMKNKYEATIEFMKQEHELAEAKAGDSISDLESHVIQLKKALEEAESQRTRQLRELEQVHQQDKMHMEHLHEKKLHSLHNEMDHNDQEMRRQIRKLENNLSDKDDAIRRLTDEHKQQAQQSEQAIEDFKSQIERQSSRVYDDMKRQMEAVESDLDRSKTLREKQAHEFVEELNETKGKYQAEIRDLKQRYEQERAQTTQNHKLQTEMIKSEHDQEVEALKDDFTSTTQAFEDKIKHQKDRDIKIITELEHQIKNLQEELTNGNQLRKQQLVELGLLREEEKQRMQRDHENLVSKLKSQLEQQRLDLLKNHSLEMETTLEKTNGRLKEIEDEYSQRIIKAQETISEQQINLEKTRAEQKRERDQTTRKLMDCISRLEEEKRLTRRQNQTSLQDLQQQLLSQQNKLRDAELRQQQEDIEHEEKMLNMKSHYEQQIRGLMPANIQQELEDTITALKSQIGSLQQRAYVLQEELDKQFIQSGVDYSMASFASPIKLAS